MDNQYSQQSEQPQRPIVSKADAYIAYIKGYQGKLKVKMLEKLQKGGVQISWFAFFFGPLYYIYRGEYAIGFIWLAVETLLDMVSALDIPYWPFSAVDWVFQIMMAFAFYSIYRNKIHKTADRLANIYDDPDRVLMELKAYGGTHVGMLWLGIAISCFGGLCIRGLFGFLFTPIVAPPGFHAII